MAQATPMANGIVTPHVNTMLPIIRELMVPRLPMKRCAVPIPMTAPTRQWDVETGMPSRDAVRSAMAAPI
eukprot:CAMPEP_0175859286 /NCGR_PEP_ID=MMETSP0107_2-20121207/30170_1 /TAXON_ID=195067 ORGANISM="Goniomonas pacifica, Strain CCMP1869" /NCGR_SAMPLE_ID=MMETSP0107_2 /ASSEMBLY_ACC=CAM_ASM_000203 /LENGTH=69 /DNA_ID=CAMNT_0017175887 /DNA_START=54 /DNA_END=263 /DNA_ORIENTATION=-